MSDMRAGSRWALAAMLLVAVNLRVPLAGLSALLDPVQQGLGLSGTAAAAVTALPPLFLGVFAFTGPGMVVRFGEHRVLLGCVVALAAGSVVRLVAAPAALFAGTALISAGIGVANVAVPALVKRDFAGRYTTVTASYTAFMTLGAAGASAAAEPLAQATGSPWVVPLALVGIPVALLAMLVQAPLAVRARPDAAGGQAREGVAGYSPWRDAVAWQLTALFAATTLIAYFTLSWLPMLARDQAGVSLGTGGLVAAWATCVQFVGSLSTSRLVGDRQDLRAVAVGAAVLTAVGLGAVVTGLLPLVWIGAAVMGYGQGVAFSLALTLFGLRAPSAAVAAAVAGTAQGVGYLVGVLGPLAGGLLHDVTGTWLAPLLMVVAAAAAQAVAGLAVGRGGVQLGCTGRSRARSHSLG